MLYRYISIYFTIENPVNDGLIKKQIFPLLIYKTHIVNRKEKYLLICLHTFLASPKMLKPYVIDRIKLGRVSDQLVNFYEKYANQH